MRRIALFLGGVCHPLRMVLDVLVVNGLGIVKAPRGRLTGRNQLVDYNQKQRLQQKRNTGRRNGNRR